MFPHHDLNSTLANVPSGLATQVMFVGILTRLGVPALPEQTRIQAEPGAEAALVSALVGQEQRGSQAPKPQQQNQRCFISGLCWAESGVLLPGRVQKMTPWEGACSEIRPKNGTDVASASGPRLAEQLPRTSHHCICFLLEVKAFPKLVQHRVVLKCPFWAQLFTGGSLCLLVMK